jgi:hypothetical protein
MNKKLLAAFGGLAAFGILTASAASLGGLTSSSLGADTTVIASCDTDGIVLSYINTYNAGPGVYTTTQVIGTGVNRACSGKSFKLTVSNGTASLNETTGVVALVGTTMTVTLSSTTVPTASITGASMVITG